MNDIERAQLADALQRNALAMGALADAQLRMTEMLRGDIKPEPQRHRINPHAVPGQPEGESGNPLAEARFGRTTPTDAEADNGTEAAT